MVSSSTLIHLLTRFFVVLALIAVTSTSARSHFGDGNQDGPNRQEDFNLFKNHYNNDGAEEYNPYEGYDYIHSLSAVYPNYLGGNREYFPRQLNDNLQQIEDDPLADETIAQAVYKRTGNTRNYDGIYRRNGIDKKIKSKPDRYGPIKCLVNPVTCFKKRASF